MDDCPTTKAISTMSAIVISWSGTIQGLHQNAITLEDLIGAKFWFQCRREHLIREDDGIPCEATWCNTVLPVKCYGATIQDVDAQNRNNTLAVLELIRQADAAGDVRWRTGTDTSDYDEMQAHIRNLPPTAIVIKGGKRMIAKDVYT